MTLFNTILPKQSTQYILVINILVDIILLFLVYSKFRSNISGTLIHYIKQYNNFLKLSFDCFKTCTVFNTTCYIETDSFSATSKSVILVPIYIVLCLQNKTFADPAIVVANVLKNWLLYCGSSFPTLTFYSIKTCQVHFITLF